MQVDLEEKGSQDGVMFTLHELARHRDEYPLRSALIVIVNGRIISVISADQVFNSTSPKRMQAAADLMGFRIAMAQHSFELRKDPEHKMIPPPLTHQKLSFGGASDKANIAIASLVSRVQLIVADEKGHNIMTPDDALLLIETEIAQTAEVFPEINEGDIRDQILNVFADR